MSKHQQTRDAVAALVKYGNTSVPGGSVGVPVTLLEDVLATIDTWKAIGEDFAASITITPGEIKPRIAVDIERFLEAQHNFKQEADDLQQGI